MQRMQADFNTSHVSVRDGLTEQDLLHSQISIHLMCRFEKLNVSCNLFLIDFNTSHVSVRDIVKLVKSAQIEFQYISCVGSSFVYGKIPLKLQKFQYISCVGSRVALASFSSASLISIHLMCRFEALREIIEYRLLLFQYISCVGSRIRHDSRSQG